MLCLTAEYEYEHTEVRAKDYDVLPGQHTMWEYIEKEKESCRATLLIAAYTDT